LIVVAVANDPSRNRKTSRHKQRRALNAGGARAAKTSAAADVVAVEIATAMATIDPSGIY
jgi:hypothetical protein